MLSPSDFLGDPLGGVGNQAGHAIGIGGGGFMVIYGIGIRLWPLSANLVAWLGVMKAYAAWEVWQVAQGGGIVDSFADWVFVAVGATFYSQLWKDDIKDARIMAGVLGIGLAFYMVTR